MKRCILLFIVIGLLLAGCREHLTEKEESTSKVTDSTIQEMSENMPNDFGFSVSFKWPVKPM